MTMRNARAKWIWLAGDFEIRHALLQNLQREERGFDWPAYWHVEDCCKSVVFTRRYCFSGRVGEAELVSGDERPPRINPLGNLSTTGPVKIHPVICKRDSVCRACDGHSRARLLIRRAG